MWLNFKIASVKFVWGLAQGMVANLGVNALIDNAFSYFGSDTLLIMQFFRVPGAITIIMTAYMSRWVFSMISSMTFGLVRIAG